MILCLSILTGCSIEAKSKEKQETADSQYYLFSINESETDIIKEPYVPADETPEGMIQDLERRIGNTNEDAEPVNLLPEGVTLSNHELSQNVLTLNFEEDYQEMGVIREILVRAALVHNFIQVPEVSAVKIKVAGQELTDSKGQEIGAMNRESFAGHFGSDKSDYQFITLNLYFADETGSKLIPETRKLYYSSNLPRERVVLEQLLRGPSQEGNYPTVSKEMNILSAITSDGVCYINLDESFEDTALPVQPEVVIYSIANSVVEACNVEKVQISVDGNSNRVFRDTMELNNFYEFNEELVQKTEAVDAKKQE